MDWDTHLSILFLPDEIRAIFREQADFLYRDLNSNHLVVTLGHAPEQKYQGHMVRCVDSENPEWYQSLYDYRNHLKRQRSLRALDRIRNIRDPCLRRVPKSAVKDWWTYDSLYREVIFERLAFGYHENDSYTPPEGIVQEFFGVEGIEKKLEPPF